MEHSIWQIKLIKMLIQYLNFSLCRLYKTFTNKSNGCCLCLMEDDSSPKHNKYYDVNSNSAPGNRREWLQQVNAQILYFF